MDPGISGLVDNCTFLTLIGRAFISRIPTALYRWNGTQEKHTKGFVGYGLPMPLGSP